MTHCQCKQLCAGLWHRRCPAGMTEGTSTANTAYVTYCSSAKTHRHTYVCMYVHAMHTCIRTNHVIEIGTSINENISTSEVHAFLVNATTQSE